MTKQSYSDKLKDPRWQKLRLKLMERTGFKCESCEDETKSLHVHHKWYKRNTAPWEYPDEAFMVLCESCHESFQSEMENAHEILGRGHGAVFNMIVIANEAIGDERTRGTIMDILGKIASAHAQGFSQGEAFAKQTTKTVAAT